jgi:Starch-binding associating with outer membrane
MRYLTRSALVVVLAAAACKTDLTGLNRNPNSPTTAPAGPLFTQAVQASISRYYGSFQTLAMSELFAQHIAQIQYVEEDRGHIRPDVIDGLFTGSYVSELEDLQKVIGQGDAANSPNTSGPARILQSWELQMMTDIWGDIPYSEAFKGDVANGALKPKYDTQKDIYYGLLKTVTDAATAMKPGSTDAGLGSADPIYKGDVAKWQRFANSLRARMAMRLLKADPAKAATELTAAFAGPGGTIASNSDNAQLAWPGDGIFDNPWAATFATRDDDRMSKTLMDTLLALNDPRVRVYAQPTKADPTKYAGLQNGLDNTTVAPFFNTTSRPGTIFYPGATSYGTFGTTAGKRTPSYLMTYAEVEFLKAEAAERGLGAQTGAAAHYNAGVRASMLQWGLTDADADAYLAQTGVAYVPGATGLQQIGLQKWISLFTQGFEAWSEWRRTGNPASIKPGPNMYADVPGIPRRLTYPSQEQSVNKASLNDAIARQGTDSYLTRIWWDK